jgi:AraC-like DNA-binding protein
LDDAIHYFDTLAREIVIPEEENGIKLLAYTMKGDEANEALYLEKAKALLNGNNKITAGSYLFFHHVLTGQFDAAFEWLEESIQQRSYVPLMRIADPLVRALRTDPRYERMRQRLFQAEKSSEETDKKNPLIKESLAEDLLQKLLEHLEKNQPYLNPELTLRKLAEEINLDANKLSWLINERLHKNFNDLINHYRIETFKSLATDPANANVTILGLAYDSGFNSKTTFNTRFKQETGMTPKQFIKS